MHSQREQVVRHLTTESCYKQLRGNFPCQRPVLQGNILFKRDPIETSKERTCCEKPFLHNIEDFEC